MPPGFVYRPRPVITELGEGFYDEVAAANFPRHILRFRNQRWAARVGLGDLDGAAWEAHFARFESLPGNLPKPLALRYHGHQFDVYNPDLGDGRGFLFAQLEDGEDDRLLDLATKGSGQTPWSRAGDGRLTLKGGVREVLATEMLEALGVPTSKTFSLFETGEALMRGDEPSPTRSSVLVRLGHSHVRFGTFQRLAYEGDTARLATLLRYSGRHYDVALRAGPEGVVDFLTEVTRRSAALVAAWMVAGFVHGVLNSDNMNICGESFDYGPYRFLPRYAPGFTAAYFDHTGLYAYGRQPVAVMRNLVRLAGSVKALAPHVDLGAALSGFEATLHEETTKRLLGRLGLRPSQGQGRGDELAAAVFAFLEGSEVGYDGFFFDLHGGLARVDRAKHGPRKAFYAGPAWQVLEDVLASYEPAGALTHPYWDRDEPVTLVIEEIEALWKPIAERDDWSCFEEKVESIREIPRPLS